MKTGTKAGIWMDHSSAHVMEFTADPIQTKIIYAKSTKEHESGTAKNENVMNNKEQHSQSDYFKRLAEIIRNHSEVLLFGPTEAKVELYNLLKSDNRFSQIKIELKQSDKMTENQQHAFVREYFTGTESKHS